MGFVGRGCCKVGEVYRWGVVGAGAAPIKFKSKISYLGKKVSILPWQMAEQLAVEVDVKNVTERGENCKKCLC